MHAKGWPKRIKVKGHSYKINYRKTKMMYNGEEVEGLCHPNEREIDIAGEDEETMALSLVHELIHAIEFEYDLPIPHELVYDLERPLLDLFMVLAARLRRKR